MRKVLFLLLVILVLSACSGNNITGKIVEDINDTLTNKSEDLNFTVPVDEAENLSEPVEESKPSDLLSEFKERQKEIYAERAEVLKKMREIGEKIYDEENSFEDRNFYQKAYDVLKQKKSELTLEATLLESDISRLEKKASLEEDLEAARKSLEELEEEKSGYVSELRELGRKMDAAREEWLAALESGNLSGYKGGLDSLEKEYVDISESLRSVVGEISDKKEFVSELEGFDISKDRKELLIERRGISKELDVVRNGLVSQYMNLKSASAEERKRIEEKISELEEREDDLEGDLMNVSRKLD